MSTERQVLMTLRTEMLIEKDPLCRPWVNEKDAMQTLNGDRHANPA